jgi:coenzyme PQQ precursor peptide PqqA
VNPLIHRWFGANSHNGVKFLLRRNIETGFLDKKIFCWRSFGSLLLYRVGRSSSGFNKEGQMAWKTPKIVEVPVGMEINMYACAARK